MTTKERKQHRVDGLVAPRGRDAGRRFRQFVVVSVILIGLCWHVRTASAEYTITMTGTIAEGSLNGESVDGDDFVVTAIVSSDTDRSPDNDTGMYELSHAVMNLRQSGEFDFDVSSTFFGLQHYPATMTSEGIFIAGFANHPIIANITDQFAYSESTAAPDFPGGPLTSVPPTFNPNVLQPLSVDTFNDFFPDGDATISFSNGDDTLTLVDLALPGSLTIVPEPSGVCLLAIAMIVIAPHRGHRRLKTRRA